MQNPSVPSSQTETIVGLEQVIEKLRHEIQRLQENLASPRMKDLELQGKETVIRELQQAADERLAVIQQLAAQIK